MAESAAGRLSTMSSRSGERWLATTGIVAGVVWAVFTVAVDIWLNEPDSVGDPAKLERVFLDHQLAAWLMVLGSILVAVTVVFFAAAAQRTLESSLGPAVIGGGVLLAVAMLVHQGVGRFALLSAAHHHDLPSIHALGYVDAVTWVFLSAGEGLFLLATGIAALRAHALPGWLTVVTLVLGALALLGPGALLFFVLAPIWFVVTGLALNRRSKVTEQGHPVVPVG
jgi:hypothetical protein